jgi:uncharacterized membrane protein YdjX (TVP38/TMEM64 family)
LGQVDTKGKIKLEMTTSPGQKSWLKQNAARLTALAFWVALILGYCYARANQLTPFQAVQALLDFFTGSLWGPLIYILAYAVRPLILFPSTLLTLAGGFVFGPLLGVLYTIVASNISSTIAFFGQDRNRPARCG